MIDYKNQICEVCRTGAPPASRQEIEEFLVKNHHWKLVSQAEQPRLKRDYHFKNYLITLNFVNQVGQLSEAQGHHPVLVVEWGSVSVEWWTHKINTIHLNDLIMASKCDALYDEYGN